MTKIRIAGLLAAVGVLGFGIWYLRGGSTPDLSAGPDGLSNATVLIETEKGNIRFKLYPKEAPQTVKRISELISSGFYSGLKFDRVIPGLAVQAGDPSGDGKTGTGQKLKAEISALQHREGTLSMARENGLDTADCIFQIAFSRNAYLEGKYTIFGQVIEGMDVVRQVSPGDVMKRVAFE